MPFCREHAFFVAFFCRCIKQMHAWDTHRSFLQCKRLTGLLKIKHRTSNSKSKSANSRKFLALSFLQCAQYYWCFLQSRLSLLVKTNWNLGTLPIWFHVMKDCKLHRLLQSFRSMWDLGNVWTVFNWQVLQTQSVPVYLMGYILTAENCLRGMEEDTQNKKAQMESGMFAALVLQGLTIIYVKPSKTA